MRRFLPLCVLALFLFPVTALAGVLSVLCVPSTTEEVVGDDMIVSHPNIDGGQQLYAGTFNVYVDCMTHTLVYCTDTAVNLCKGTQYVQGPNLEDPRIVWILNNYYPAVPGMPSELATDVQRKAAVQLAIWHFSDNVDISTGGSDPVVFAAANAIIAVAQTATVPLTPTSIVLTPPDTPPPPPTNPMTVTATLYDQYGAVMPNVTVNWEVTHPHKSGSGVTDENGQITASWNWVGYGLLTFTVDYTIPIGLSWVNPACQDLIQGVLAPGRVTAEWGEDVTIPAEPVTWGSIKNLYQ